MYLTQLARNPTARAVMPADGATRTALALTLIATADFLFYGRQVGISVFVFLALLAAAAVLGNRLSASTREWALAGAILVLSLIPAVENVGIISLSCALAGVALFTLVVTGNARVAWRRFPRRIAVLLTGDIFGSARRHARWRRAIQSGKRRDIVAFAAGWIVPVVLGTVFVTLFAAANPVFEAWLRLEEIWRFITGIELFRPLFWVLVTVFVWAFISVPVFTRWARKDAKTPAIRQRRRLGTLTIVRSLILFNAIFALQTASDAIYLWGGVELPKGVSPAGDAQEAAYILVVTALLAAAFVLVALRNSDDERAQRLIRSLIYLWIAQNVVLVLSAILRLDLYVGIYALTRLRIAAFIWMSLVVTGLVLIVFRIARSKTNDWLVRANLISLGIALYASGIVDLDAVVANYNVRHSREITGKGAEFDRDYICRLGPSALPAVDFYLHEIREKSEKTGAGLWEPDLYDCADQFRETAAKESNDWRGWTFRRHRLQLYLTKQAEARGKMDDGTEDIGR